MHESRRDASSKVLIDYTDTWKQRTQKRGRRGPHPQACGVNWLQCVAASQNVWYNGWRGRPRGEDGHEGGDDPDDERNERATRSGPEEGRARCDDQERNQRQVDPRVSRPERWIGRQQRIEHVGSEELAHSEGTVCSTG